jgi:hypothetical protein
MMSAGEYLKLTGDKMVEQRKPTMKSVFSGKFFSSNNNKSTAAMATIKVHDKSREELAKMKITELKAMIKQHNLHNAIKGYSTMKKSGLVEKLFKHSTRASSGGGARHATKDPSPLDGASPKRGRGRPKKVAAPEPEPIKRGRGRPKKVVVEDAPQPMVRKPAPPKKQVRKSTRIKVKKDKASEILVPGLNKPIYGKKGVLKGATEQFEKRYGKMK